MKKCLATILLVIVATLCMTTALADGDMSNYAFGFTAQCVNTTSLSHATQYHTKQGSCTIIEVRHSVIGNGSSAGHTNYMYGYVQQDDTYYGAKWQAPDSIYHSCTSDLLWPGDLVTPGGRGNTKYYDSNGLTSIRIEGQFRPH